MRRPSRAPSRTASAPPRGIAAGAAEAVYAQALRHHREGRLDEAVALYRRTLAARPDFAEAQYNLGVALSRQDRPDEAIACHRRAIALRPDLPEAQFDLGCLLAARGETEAAAACFRHAIAARPDYVAAHNNLANALKELGRPEEALASHRAALRLRPDIAALHFNLGNTLKALDRPEEALAAWRRAVALKPDYAEAHHALSVLLLARGEMAAGWEAFEWRWRAPRMVRSRRDFAQRQWRGEEARGRTLLIHAEQGFGDTLQFCRYASLAAARGPRVIVEAQPPLVRLLGGLDGVAQVVARGDALPAFDLHCPMMSLPLALGTTLETIPANVPYLHADPARTAELGARLATLDPPGRMRVGLVWAGNPRADLPPRESAHAQRRSLDPALLAPLLAIPGARFVSLQKAGPASPAAFGLIDPMAEMADFADTAALIASLDLVISVDTSVAHLAGALGKPVWVMTRRDHCWRWLEGRTDSPWYPTLRLYRQTIQDEWGDVVARVAADLRGLAASH
jgi:tetratricopeptide (TPR) repeat protein